MMDHIVRPSVRRTDRNISVLVARRRGVAERPQSGGGGGDGDDDVVDARLSERTSRGKHAVRPVGRRPTAIIDCLDLITRSLAT